ncbi:MAG TPA: VOC family protein [Chloroflexia bacterium]|nr:VOC family protein [Chloroflexia bacterium]
MAIKHVSTVTIHVSDQDRALDFYVNKLGFEVREDAPFGENTDLRWIEVAPPGAHTGMVLAKGYGGWTPESVGGFAGIVFESNNIQATYEELSARGVTFTEPPTMQPWGMMQALFQDQDGNRFVLIAEPRYIQRPRQSGALKASDLADGST